MTKINLSVSPRTAKGRVNKSLRRSGIIPGVIYGKGQQGVSVQAKLTDLQKVYTQAGETQVIDVKVEGEKNDRPTLISDLSVNPLSGAISHFDLRQVNLKEKITATVPVELVGESPAIKEFGADVVLLLNELSVEALPNDFPEAITVELSTLTKVGDHVKVSDLVKPNQAFEIQEDIDAVVVTISKKEEEVVEAAPVAETTTPTATPAAPAAKA